MSTVEPAVRTVKRLSSRQTRELLDWLAERQPDGGSTEQRSRASHRKAKPRRSMQELLARYDAVRGAANRQPPSMPDEKNS